MNKKLVASCALAAAILAGPAAFAQTASPSPSTTSPPMPDRQMGPGPMMRHDQTQMQRQMRERMHDQNQGQMQGQMDSSASTVDRSQLDLNRRAGPNQREMEMVQTSLLNRFGGMGFAEMRNFRKIGENYAAEVRTVEGVWVNVLIDPATGAVTVQQ
jgi:hypothetical protein